ncbi:unnamed protein product [Moneuplotes crassus]|uniref:Uncharacterized protein n=1 Tax=Euplotes crassus TaxID=5936 RepID=A0AAD1XEA6_EUPCR|nr:unnamed protein product [Moneuplotes crassus]
MKLILAIFATLIALVYSRDECRVFSCSSIENEERVKHCAERDENDFGSWNVKQCNQKNSFCKTFGFKSPGALQYPARCEVIEPEEGEEEEKPFANNLGVGVEGDHCESYKDCHRSYYSKAKCEDNVCKASTKEGSKCKVHIDCPMGHFCDSKTCVKSRKAGQNCTKEIECEIGHSCLQLVEHDNQENICIPDSYLDDGVLFSYADTGFFNIKETDNLEGKQLEPTFSSHCESINQVQLGKNLFQCRKADTNLIPDLSRKAKGSNCIIQTYTHEDPKMFELQTNKTEKSLCGFNKDSKAWCPLKAGDKIAQYLYFNWVDKKNSFKCSRFSQNDPQTGSICHDLFVAQQADDEDLFSFTKFKATVLNPDSAQVWANTANNNICVAKSLTQDFWGNHFATFSHYTH